MFLNVQKTFLNVQGIIRKVRPPCPIKQDTFGEFPEIYQVIEEPSKSEANFQETKRAFGKL